MNKKKLLIKIVEFICKVNVKYKESKIGDLLILVPLTVMIVIGQLTALSFILILLVLRAIYEFGILERLGVIDEEETNKNDNQDFENIR